jgi:hypothetical protein
MIRLVAVSLGSKVAVPGLVRGDHQRHLVLTLGNVEMHAPLAHFQDRLRHGLLPAFPVVIHTTQILDALVGVVTLRTGYALDFDRHASPLVVRDTGGSRPQQ